jgi:hydroxymethylbilane synthase
MAKAALEECGIEAGIEIIRAGGDEHPQFVVPNEAEGSRRATFEGTSKRSLDFAREEGRKGLFTAELERALRDKRIDVAVHSAKDLPSDMNNALSIAAVFPRGPVEDLLIMKRLTGPPLKIVATGSVRRQRQARWLKKPLEIVDLRGNVPTRLRKFAASDWDAIILARAGLERLGFSVPEFVFEEETFFAEVLPIAQFVPAGGQGVIALQTRAEDAPIISTIDHRETHWCLRAERELLRLLQGDCDLPVGVHARYIGGEMELRVQLFGDKEGPKMGSARGNDPEKLARELFEKIERE